MEWGNYQLNNFFWILDSLYPQTEFVELKSIENFHL